MHNFSNGEIQDSGNYLRIGDIFRTLKNSIHMKVSKVSQVNTDSFSISLQSSNDQSALIFTFCLNFKPV